MPLPRCALFALAFGLLATVGNADDLTTNGGKKLSGKLVAIDQQGVTFTTGESRVTVSGKDLVLVDLGHKIAPVTKETRYNEIELTDGSTLRVGKFAVKGRKIETTLATIPDGITAPTFELPLNSVFSVMRGAEEQKNRDAWKKMLGTRGKRDIYVERTPTGFNLIQGTILSGSDDGLTFDFELESGAKPEKPLIQSRASGGLVLSPAPVSQVPHTLCKVQDVFGNELVAQAVEMTPEGVTVTTVSGVAIKYTSTAGIARFDYAQGNVAYLSDLDPKIEAPELPPEEKALRLNVISPILRDKGVSGEALKFGTDVFPKGLVIASETILTYNLGGDYREFKAIAGLPETSPDANLEARVTIEADGNRVFFETIKRKDRPKPIGLDMKGVKQLRIIVESDLPVNGNRIILADARVQK
jgi:hypothetical protein